MFRVQKKMERHFIYRLWVLLRVAAYSAAGFALLRGVLRSLSLADFSGFGPLVGQVGSGFGAWLVFEFIGEKIFAARQNAKKKKPKKGEKPDKTERRASPKVRIFYRRLTLSHLLPGKMNPVLAGLSEQDMEYNAGFRWYAAIRYVGYIALGLVTLMLIFQEPFIKKSWPGEGLASALIPFFLVRALESALLYLFLGSVMTGDDIHGSKTTRFFAFEPSASFIKRLTMPILDRKGWIVSLYALRSRLGLTAWWLFRLITVVAVVVFTEAADAVKISSPKLISPALAVLIPFSIFYLGMALDKALGYLVFFPAAKNKKKEDTATRTVEYRSVG